MRVMIDVVHPAHVHFYRNLWSELVARGDEVLVVSRDKDVTLALLDHFGIEHVPVGRAGRRSIVGHGLELAHRDLALIRLGRRFRPDIVLTRNPAGVQAARILRVPGVFDTDDGTAAGIHWRAAAPFATVITSSVSLGEDHGSRHWRYQGYKALTPLHPARFTPDPTVRQRLGLSPGERLFVVRFVAMAASHDLGESGMAETMKRELVALLGARGRVVISSEAPLPPDLAHLAFPLDATELHDALAAADLVVGDSQTVTAEAALLGTPAVRASSFTGRLEYLRELEERYGLVRSFRPDDEDAIRAAVLELADDPDVGATWLARRATMLAEQVDVTAWYLDLVDLVVARHR